MTAIGSHGASIFGRRTNGRRGSSKNSTKTDAGYPAPTALPTATLHYKSATRGYIESIGYEIVADFGDQFSDFTGGLRGAHVQDAEPELLPAVGGRTVRIDVWAPKGRST